MGEPGLRKFVFESPPPSREQLQCSGVFLEDGGLDVSAICISAEYRDQEFCRVGYFYRLEYDDPELAANPPTSVDWSRLCVVLSEEPNVTRFPIKWDSKTSAGSSSAAGQPTEEPVMKRQRAGEPDLD